MVYRSLFTNKDGKLYIKRDLRTVRFPIMLLLLGSLPMFINFFREHIFVAVISVFAVFGSLLIITEVRYHHTPKRAIVLGKTEVACARPFKVGSTTELSNNPDPYISMTHDSGADGKFTLGIDDVSVDFDGLATDVYLMAYLFYNHEIADGKNLQPDLFLVFERAFIPPDIYVRLFVFLIMLTVLINGNPIGFWVGLMITNIQNMSYRYFGKKTGISIYQNKIALTNKEMGGGILEISDISRIEDDQIFDRYGNVMTFEGIEGKQYRKLARILDRFIEKQA